MAEGDPTDLEIEARLRAIPLDRRAALDLALADFRLERRHGGWEGGGAVASGALDRHGRPVLQMSWVERSPGLDRLVGEAVAAGLVFPFDWQTWQADSGFDGSPPSLSGAAVADAVRFLTAVVRGDRFVEGLLLERADDGSLAAGVERVLTWLREDGGPSA